MTFWKPGLALASAFALITACGGGAGDTSGETKNSVENRDVSSGSSDSEPSATPVAEEADPNADAFAALPEPYNTADYDRGRRTFKLCMSCHTLNEGGQNLVGPNLYGMFGRRIGAVDGFAYSDAVNEADFIWTPDILAQWLESPRDFLPGNKMAFAGVRKPDDRTAVIAYIMSETGYTSDE